MVFTLIANKRQVKLSEEQAKFIVFLIRANILDYKTDGFLLRVA